MKMNNKHSQRVSLQSARSPRPFFWTFLAILIAVLGLAWPMPLAAQVRYTPQDPKVQEMIRRGLAFIEKESLTNREFGFHTMYALAAYKSNILFEVDDYKDHVLIDGFLVMAEAISENSLDNASAFNTTYAAALACVLLLELDADAHRSKIELLLDYIYRRQQDQGAWGYRDEPSLGDVSQMQYIALALWLAQQKGFEVNPDVCKRALDWMIQYQKPDGGWGYKNPPENIPGSIRTNLMTDVRHSLVAAGLGTLYLYADNLQLYERQDVRAGATNASMNLPRAVVDVTNESEEDRASGSRRARASYDVSKLRAAMGQGNSWFTRNFAVQVDMYNLYYLYGFERYIALRQYLDGPLTPNSGVGTWYDQGVDFLESIQQADGRFRGEEADIPDDVNTAFAILFLTQSMSITLGDKATGRQRGFEFDGTSNKPLVERDGKVVSSSIEQSLGEFLDMMANSDANQLAMFSDSLKADFLNTDNASRGEILQKLRLLVNHENPLARIRAVKVLASTRSLDNAPALIFALTDPHADVVLAAHEGMKFVSRKTSVPDLPWDPQFSDKLESVRMWIEWYEHVKPDGQLLELPPDFEKALAARSKQKSPRP